MYHKGKDKDGYKSACKECRNKENKKYEKTDKRQKYYLDNKERKELYRRQNIENIKNKHKEWVENNKEHLREIKKQYHKNRLLSDPSYAMQYKLRGNINSRIKKYSKTGKTSSISSLGIDFQLIFDNIGPRPGKEYVLDHIIPVVLFDYTNEQHIILSNSWYNLQWLTKKENNIKSDIIKWDIIQVCPELLALANSIGLTKEHHNKSARNIKLETEPPIFMVG
jgi:hypothetical protein